VFFKRQNYTGKKRAKTYFEGGHIIFEEKKKKVEDKTRVHDQIYEQEKKKRRQIETNVPTLTSNSTILFRNKGEQKKMKKH